MDTIILIWDALQFSQWHWDRSCLTTFRFTVNNNIIAVDYRYIYFFFSAECTIYAFQVYKFRSFCFYCRSFVSEMWCENTAFPLTLFITWLVRWLKTAGRALSVNFRLFSFEKYRFFHFTLKICRLSVQGGCLFPANWVPHPFLV